LQGGFIEKRAVAQRRHCATAYSRGAINALGRKCI
jgi:hypothetical protein